MTKPPPFKIWHLFSIAMTLMLMFMAITTLNRLQPRAVRCTDCFLATVTMVGQKWNGHNDSYIMVACDMGGSDLGPDGTMIVLVGEGDKDILPTIFNLKPWTDTAGIVRRHVRVRGSIVTCNIGTALIAASVEEIP